MATLAVLKERVVVSAAVLHSLLACCSREVPGTRSAAQSALSPVQGSRADLPRLQRNLIKKYSMGRSYTVVEKRRGDNEEKSPHCDGLMWTGVLLSDIYTPEISERQVTEGMISFKFIGNLRLETLSELKTLIDNYKLTSSWLGKLEELSRPVKLSSPSKGDSSRLLLPVRTLLTVHFNSANNHRQRRAAMAV